jgi:DNA-binding response OmpR family regulator
VERRPLETDRQLARRIHADRDHRQAGGCAAKGPDQLVGAGKGGLDHEGVDVNGFDASFVDERFVPERRDEVHEELAHLGMRFCDQDPRHGHILGGSSRFRVGVWYEIRVKGARVLVVDDDADVRNLVRTLLDKAGYSVAEAPDGRAGLRSLHASPPDLVILDVTMPGLDGWAILERIRDLSDVPVLMLSARHTEFDKVRALQGGADDYVTKPFGRQELLARVDVLLRRERSRAGAGASYIDGRLEIDFGQRLVTVAGEELRLTPLEFKLLSTFVRHPNQVLSREQLLDLVWGDARAVSRDQVKLYVGYLRKKLGSNVEIETVRGFGYRFKPA